MTETSPDAPIAPGLLTPRERQVAAGLAAGGYTARQIAGRLHIGSRTSRPPRPHLPQTRRCLQTASHGGLHHLPGG